VQSRNDLENYVFSLKNTLLDENVSKKLSEEDKKTFQQLVDDSLKWIDQHATSATEDEFKQKQKEMEDKSRPIMMKIY
jgi:molecular chaperone DnaK (HSP70)